MDILWYGLKVSFVGLLVVFIGLAILIGCIKALKSVGAQKETPTAAPPASPPVAVPPAADAALPQPVREYTPGPPLQTGDDALFAVLTASVAATLAAEGVNPEGGFAIRSVKPVGAHGPKLSVKDSALYAVLTAAIAATLEAEGVNPEGGFAIRSVKAI